MDTIKTASKEPQKMCVIRKKTSSSDIISAPIYSITLYLYQNSIDDLLKTPLADSSFRERRSVFHPKKALKMAEKRKKSKKVEKNCRTMPSVCSQVHIIAKSKIFPTTTLLSLPTASTASLDRQKRTISNDKKPTIC